MKKIILTAVLIAASITAANAQKIKGSDTVLPLSQQEAESFMKANPSATVTVTGGGSGVGLSALLEGTTDIAQASRRIKFDEPIVVNPANKVTNLTREQLEGIFTGKITNWKEVGGADMKIVPYARETSSGTYEFFKESVLKNKNYMNGIMSMPATGAIIQSISQTKGGIGYVGLAYLNSSVKPIHVSYDNGKTFTEPSVENAKNETYPIVRPLYYYYEAGSAGKVKSFIDYVLSPTGQRIVSEVGFIPVK